VDTKRTAFVGLAVIAVLTVAYLLSMGSGRSAASSGSGGEAPAPITSAPAPPFDPQETREPLASTSLAVDEAKPEPIGPADETPPSAKAPPPLTESTSEAAAEILRMLANKDFLEACAHLEDAATPLLEGLVTEGRRAVSALASEEGIKRGEAGLYKPIPGAKFGEPFTPHLNEGDLIQSIYGSGAGDINLVELPRAEYPELYSLRDATKRFDEEVRARAKKKARR
jgi:hypothetical protein